MVKLDVLHHSASLAYLAPAGHRLLQTGAPRSRRNDRSHPLSEMLYNLPPLQTARMLRSSVVGPSLLGGSNFICAPTRGERVGSVHGGVKFYRGPAAAARAY